MARLSQAHHDVSHAALLQRPLQCQAFGAATGRAAAVTRAVAFPHAARVVVAPAGRVFKGNSHFLACLLGSVVAHHPMVVRKELVWGNARRQEFVRRKHSTIFTITMAAKIVLN